MGTIFRRGSGKDVRYYIRLDLPRGPDGVRRRMVRRVNGAKRDAEAALRKAEAEVRTGGVPAPRRVTVGDILERWLASVERSVEPATFTSYRRQVQRLTVALGSLRLQTLSPMHIQEWLNGPARERRRGEGELSDRAVQLQWRVFSMALEQARRQRIIDFNPCEAVKTPSAARPDPRFLDGQQAAALLDALRGEWLYLPALLALTAGLRAGEVCALAWSDVDLDMGCLTVRHSLDSSTPRALRIKTTKTGAIGRLGLPQEVIQELRLARAVAAGEWVVCEPDGRFSDPEYLSRRFSKRARALGFDLTFHGLRHTHATLLLSQGVHPRIAMQQMRHSSIAMLQHYSHVLPAMQQDAVDQIGAALFQEHHPKGDT